MNIFHPKKNADGSIDMEIDHPVHGRIPYTLRDEDGDAMSKAIRFVMDGMNIKADPYVPPPPDPDRDATYQTADAAKKHLTAYFDDLAKPMIKFRPFSEMLAWPAKEQAARAVVAGTATPDETAFIAAEAAVTGEADADLAAYVITKADQYRAVSGAIAGFRRKAHEQIDAASLPQEFDAAVEAITAEADAWAATVGLAQ